MDGGFKATVGVGENADDVDFYAGANWSGGGFTVGVVWFNAQAGGKDAVAAKDAVIGPPTGSITPGTTQAVVLEEAVAAVPGSGGNAWRIVAAYDLGFVAPGAAVRGWYSDDDGETDYSAGSRWGVTGKVGLGDDLTLFGGYSQHESAPVNPADAEETTNFTIGVAWTPVSGLLVQPEYTSTDKPEGTADENTLGVRIVRSF